jgi:hypothetical protein
MAVGTFAVEDMHRASPTFQAASIAAISSRTLTRRLRRQFIAAVAPMLDGLSCHGNSLNLFLDTSMVLRIQRTSCTPTGSKYSQDFVPNYRNHTCASHEAFLHVITDEIQQQQTIPRCGSSVVLESSCESCLRASIGSLNRGTVHRLTR